MSSILNCDCTYFYFKPSGKWKYEGRGRFPRPQHTGWHKIDREEIIRENGCMPGINSNAVDMIVIVIPDDDCEVGTAYPRMIHPTEETNEALQTKTSSTRGVSGEVQERAH